jgi:hypothetical protein
MLRNSVTYNFHKVLVELLLLLSLESVKNIFIANKEVDCFFVGLYVLVLTCEVVILCITRSELFTICYNSQNGREIF